MKPWSPLGPVILLLLLSAGCTDNAVRLRRGIERSARHLYQGTETRQVVRYRPVAAPDKPYWLVFFPEGRTYEEDLVRSGVPAAVAAQIFRELGYIDIGHRRKLVVWQPGERLSFTDYQGRDPVIVRRLIAVNRVGPAEILLEKEDGVLFIQDVR